jgi:surfactin synthase thioesterase subunit
MYRQWPVEYMGVNFCPVQLPGRENRLREPHFGTYQQLAGMLAEHLARYLDRPYALFGHCSSALAAYETAVRLIVDGLPAPCRLFVSSEVAPQDGPYGSFLEMDDEALAGQLRTLFATTGGSPSPGFIDMTLGVLRQDLAANGRYHVADPPVLPCPITTISWRQDREVTPELMGGWSACGTTEPVLLDGDHYQFTLAPDELLRQIALGCGTTASASR